MQVQVLYRCYSRCRSVSRRLGEEEEGCLTYSRALVVAGPGLATEEGDGDRCPRYLKCTCIVAIA